MNTIHPTSASTSSVDAEHAHAASVKLPEIPRKEALCFTAGPGTVVFSAGVVHAYLASGRNKPAIVAGISSGALSAAATQRCYFDLEAAKTGKTSDTPETARWRWFRRYLGVLFYSPLTVIWDGLPDQSDFFAELPPVRDASAVLFDQNGSDFSKDSAPTSRSDAEESAIKEFAALEREARRELFLYVKLGHWLSRLGLQISAVAELLIKRVRAKENYPGPKATRVGLYWLQFLKVASRLVLHTALHPEFFPEYKFAATKNETNVPPRTGVRPILGWSIYLSCLALLLIGLVVGIAIFLLLVYNLLPYTPTDLRWLGSLSPRLWSAAVAGAEFTGEVLIGLLIFVALPIIAAICSDQIGNKLKDHATTVLNSIMQTVMTEVQLEKHLVHPFHLRLRLTRLFGQAGVSPVLENEPFPALLVTAPLEQLGEGEAVQLWAAKGTPVVDALMASLALPGLFAPLDVSTKNNASGKAPSDQWLNSNLRSSCRTPIISLVDGAVVRKNPLPALFNYLKDPSGTLITEALMSRDAAHSGIHVVYGQPVRKLEVSEFDNEIPDIVDVARRGLRLQTRRDTEMEILQTNFTSELERIIREGTSVSSETGVAPIFADAIAPQKDISLGEQPLSASCDTFYRVAADGCRATLENLYRDELFELSKGRPSVACSELLKAKPGGLPEICSKCHQCLQVTSPSSIQTAKTIGTADAAKFACLTLQKSNNPSEVEPLGRIVFIASGGVFRGSFQAGMLACMLAAQIRPQLIVGASVGTLMGGALAALLTTATYEQAVDRLGDLVHLLLHVDEQIAFTKSFKNAVREIGIRARHIHLSLNQIRKMVAAGARSDIAFALAGAPAPLLDALSDLLMMPHEMTKTIASRFVSGKVSLAVQELLQAIRKETLHRLQIEQALIGTSLMRSAATRLLNNGRRLSSCQPYLPELAFFCTTTDLNEERSVVLGGEFNKSYDFLEGALASSAFPAVFSPRRQSEVFPGQGEVNRYFSDGGLFDNLPFFPAIETLAVIQRSYALNNNIPATEYLRARFDSPDLFLVGSLDVESSSDPDAYGKFDDLVSILQRASLLQNNIKIDSFIESSNRVYKQLDFLFDKKTTIGGADDRLINGVVNAGTMAIYPSDKDHLNPTFAFCRSTGFRTERVNLSIADGCFQTFRRLLNEYGQTVESSKNPVLTKSVHSLKDCRIPNVNWNSSERVGHGRKMWKKQGHDGMCPYFVHSTDTQRSHGEAQFVGNNDSHTFVCPFYEASRQANRSERTAISEESLRIYKSCCSDDKHLKLWEKGIHRS